MRIDEMKHVELGCAEITDAVLIPSGDLSFVPGFPIKNVPEHIRICVTARPETGSHIQIELWLPTAAWNGDMVGIGNGGSAGTMLPMMLAGPLRLGFAAVTTDMGTSSGPDCGIRNQAVWRDFGFRSTHLMTQISKALIQAYYGKSVQHAYFVGGSTGGQQALSEAQRYPEDYDGILACAPAYDRVHLHMAFLWDWQHLTAVGMEAISHEQERAIVRALLDQCGSQGERHEGDDFFYRPDRIRVERKMLEDVGLSDRQHDALMAVYHGLQGVYEPTLTPGSEAGDMGIACRCDREKFAKDFFYLFRWVLDADFDFSKFDFDRDGQRVREALCPLLDATNEDLTAFRDRGGKILLIHGTADPIIPMASSIRYYENVQKRMGDTSDFFRLFLAPGMGHVFGGPGVQDIVYGLPATPKDEKHLGLLALKAWVEDGKAPDKLYPVAFKKDSPLSAYMPDGVAWEREITPYSSAK